MGEDYHLTIGGVRMAYNYSTWFLEAYKDVAGLMVELAKSRGQAQKAFESPDDARRYRHFLSNVRACALRNNPFLYGEIRNVRTWIEYSGEMYRVFIGLPRADQRIRGARPEALLPASAPELAPSNATNRLVFTVALTQENWNEVRLKMDIAAKEKKEIQFIVFDMPPPTEIMAHIAGLYAEDFEVVENIPNFVLKRLGSTLPWIRAR